MMKKNMLRAPLLYLHYVMPGSQQWWVFFVENIRGGQQQEQCPYIYVKILVPANAQPI